MTHPFTLRRAHREDLPRIVEIYNQAILTTTATFDTEVKTLEDQEPWWNSHDDRLAVYVAEHPSAGVVGWGSLSRFSDRCAYGATAELSLYIHEDFRGHGLGQSLIQTLLDHLLTTDLRTVISRVAGDNQVSLHLHKKAGFLHRGTLVDVGYKFGRYLDVHYLQWTRPLPQD